MKIDCFKWKPERIFVLLILLHLVFWTLLPALVNPNLPLDVIEGLSWGREWQLGYHKHPPMKPWLLEITAALSNRGDWAVYLLSQICVVIAFWGMWRLAREFVSPNWALISVLLLEGVYYHNYTSPEFNVNVAELPFWALTGLCVWLALRRNSNFYGILTGLFIGLGILSKYIFGFLILTILLMMLWVPSFRKAFKISVPYLAAVTAFLVVLPHLIWAVEHDFVTITYGLDRVAREKTIIDHVWYPFRFTFSQTLILIPSLLLLFTLRSGRKEEDPAIKSFEKSRFLVFMTFGPPAMMVLLSLVFGWKIRSMWATPLFLFSGLTLVYFLRARLSLERWRTFACVWGVFFLLPLSAYWAEARVVPIFTHQGNRVHFPGKALAETVMSQWHRLYQNPPGAIIGTFWHAGNLSYYYRSRPSVFIDANPVKSPWIDKETLRKKGAIIVAKDKKNAYWLVPKGLDRIVDMGEIRLPYQYAGDVPPVSLWLVFLPPS